MNDPLTEQLMLATLARGEIRLPALNIHTRAIHTKIASVNRTEIQADAVVDISWQSKTHGFLVECKTLSTPKTIDAAIGQVKQYSNVTRLSPMIFVPYLSPQALEQLEASGVSGVDLSGNGIICVPGEMLVYKTGAPNKFPSRRKGPNPYRGVTSLTARTLAIQPKFESSRALLEFIGDRGGSVTQSTVSKALDELEEDLIIRRYGRAIMVLQYDVLLDSLVQHFERPHHDEIRTYKISGTPSEFSKIILDRAAELEEPIVITGIGSASHYTAMAQSPPLPIYCRRIDLLDGLADPKSRFPNITITRMTDIGTYYDTRLEDGWPWASPVQTYLELMNGSARDYDMAHHVRRIFAPDADVSHSLDERELGQ